METSEILRKLEKAVPGAVVNQGFIGQSRDALIYVQAGLLREVATFLKQEPTIGLDWLDNLSVFQDGDLLKATYFLRSRIHSHGLILRSVISLGSSGKEVDFPSVSAIWEMAESFEVESGELFGVRYTTPAGERAHRPFQRLPKEWSGYPLRKRYVFPSEFLGISHTRKIEVESK